MHWVVLINIVGHPFRYLRREEINLVQIQVTAKFVTLGFVAFGIMLIAQLIFIVPNTVTMG